MLEDTGFSSWLCTGDRILPFRNVEEVIAVLEEVDRRYAHHAAAARKIVMEHFEAKQAFPSLLERAMNPPDSRTKRRESRTT
ncbi:MAG: hypothetical protein OEZ08_06655 [Betaproteobacteria bacterium]|nr:hypothetical protein [Betaproteobacteria bacterium]